MNMKWPADEIVTKKTQDLIPYVNNSRVHSESQVAQIAASIKEWGFTNPVLIDEQGGIIAGHGRVQAALKLGIDEVPCVIAKNWTEAQKKAYVLADNQLAQNSSWNNELLSLEVEALKNLNFDIDLIGFDQEFLNGLQVETEIIESNCDADEVPETAKDSISKPGDVWLLGKHRVMCGDSTNIQHVELLMNNQTASLLHADPPYGMGKEKDGVVNDNLTNEKLDTFQMEWWATYRTFLVDNASVYIWGNPADLWRLWYLGGLQESERLTLRNEVVWDKKSAQGMRSELHRMYATATERALFFVLGEQGFNNNADNYWEGWEPIRSYLENEMKKAGWTIKDLNRITGTNMAGHWVTKSQWTLITEEHYIKIQQAACKHAAFKREHAAFKREHAAIKQDFYATRAYFDNTHDNMTDVWEYEKVTGNERHGHATPKPVAMMERVMKSSLPVSGLCVEPFGGSGSTLMGAEKSGRTCFTMEITPQYVDVIVKRWENFTGKKAIHEETGKKFQEMSEEVEQNEINTI